MEVETWLCLTEAVIRTHKIRECKAKSDIDRYYGTCMGNNFSLKNQL